MGKNANVYECFLIFFGTICGMPKFPYTSSAFKVEQRASLAKTNAELIKAHDDRCSSLKAGDEYADLGIPHLFHVFHSFSKTILCNNFVG